MADRAAVLEYTFFRPSSIAWRKTSGPATVQNRVQPIDILEPLPRSAMHDLGEIANRRLPQFQ